jgi:hypothetical protein
MHSVCTAGSEKGKHSCVARRYMVPTLTSREQWLSTNCSSPAWHASVSRFVSDRQFVFAVPFTAPALEARLTHLTCPADSGNFQTCSRICTASTNADWGVKRRFKTKYGSHLQTTNIETSATANLECATEGWGFQLGYACFWRRLQAERGDGVRCPRLPASEQP